MAAAAIGSFGKFLTDSKNGLAFIGAAISIVFIMTDLKAGLDFCACEEISYEHELSGGNCSKADPPKLICVNYTSSCLRRAPEFAEGPSCNGQLYPREVDLKAVDSGNIFLAAAWAFTAVVFIGVGCRTTPDCIFYKKPTEMTLQDRLTALKRDPTLSDLVKALRGVDFPAVDTLPVDQRAAAEIADNNRRQVDGMLKNAAYHNRVALKARALKRDPTFSDLVKTLRGVDFPAVDTLPVDQRAAAEIADNNRQQVDGMLENAAYHHRVALKARALERDTTLYNLVQVLRGADFPAVDTLPEYQRAAAVIADNNRQQVGTLLGNAAYHNSLREKLNRVVATTSLEQLKNFIVAAKTD